jgi:hypothetical protein
MRHTYSFVDEKRTFGIRTFEPIPALVLGVE